MRRLWASAPTTSQARRTSPANAPIIRELLFQCGYQKFVAELELPEAKPAKRKYSRRAKPEVEDTLVEEQPKEVVEAPTEDPAPQPESAPQLPPSSEALTAKDLQNLIFALYVQAKAGIASSKDKLDQIKLVILHKE